MQDVKHYNDEDTYDVAEDYNSFLMEKAKELRANCYKYKIPMIFIAAVANNCDKTVYETEMISAMIANRNLTDDKIAKFVNVLNGFNTVPPVDMTEIEFESEKNEEEEYPFLYSENIWDDESFEYHLEDADVVSDIEESDILDSIDFSQLVDEDELAGAELTEYEIEAEDEYDEPQNEPYTGYNTLASFQEIPVIATNDAEPETEFEE